MATAIAAMVLAACSIGGSATPAPTSDTGLPEQSWSVVSESINVAFATPDLAPGNRRVAFALSDNRGLIRFPVISLKSYFYPDGFEGGERTGPVEESTARFYGFPLGTRGIHTAYLSLDQTGDWSVEASVPRSDGSVESVEIRFAVNEETHSVDINEVPPGSDTRTVNDVASLEELTTGSLHDPALYQVSLSDALGSGRPTVVAFASPAFCTNAICGPQDEVVSELHTAYGDEVNFIHIDLYENPHEIQGDLDRGIESPVLKQWGLISQEWTFVLDSEGRISARFENFAPKEELVPEIEKVLGSY
jgi:hypothetical protein